MPPIWRIFLTIRLKISRPSIRWVIGDPWLRLVIRIAGNKQDKAQTIDTWHGVPIESNGIDDEISP
jgi:hypothetical protein